MVYGRAIERQGLLMAAMRIYHRVWQLYVAHVFLFMQFMATTAYLVDTFNNAIYAEELRAADFLKEPGLAVIKALTLQFQPEFMDILPLYIVLLALLPLVLIGFRLWPAGVLAASFSLWAAAQFGRLVRLARGQGRDSLAHQPLAVPAGGGWRARRVPDPLQLDTALALRSLPRALRQCAVAPPE